MKRFLAIILAGLMLLSLAACGGKDEKGGTGAMDGFVEMDGFAQTLQNHYAEKHDIKRPDNKNYSNLSAAILDLQNGNIDELVCNKTTGEYILAHNKGSELLSEGRKKETNFSMMTMDSNKEVFDILNNAIVEMKADGTLDSLIENELKSYINSDPEAKDLPKFDGARTIKVGVTGDVPPMDFVAANGKAAGFNIALLTEIANRAQVNIEIDQIESGARPMALSSGKVDVVFWTKNVTCLEHNESWAEKVEGTLVTESYFSDYAAIIKLKDNK
jgi:ABC-type amino acid transport substrate-binding protein